MIKKQQIEKLSSILEGLLKDCSKNNVEIGYITKKLGINSDAVILFFVSAAFSFPLSIPGLSVPFGILLCFLGFWIILGKELWLPSWLLSKKIPYLLLEKMVHKTNWLFSKLEWVIHPRLLFICTHFIFKRISGVMIFILALLLAIPLPIPLTNVLAAFPILLLSIGILENDGLFILFGYIGFVISLSAFWTIFYTIITSL